MKAVWKMEPGDGTGCSIADAMVRNERGLCSIQGCNNPITSDAISYGLFCKMCPDCENELTRTFTELL